MWLKILSVVFAGVFVGAAIHEIKTDKHGKAKRPDDDGTADDANADDATEQAGEQDPQERRS